MLMFYLNHTLTHLYKYQALTNNDTILDLVEDIETHNKENQIKPDDPLPST